MCLFGVYRYFISDRRSAFLISRGDCSHVVVSLDWPAKRHVRSQPTQQVCLFCLSSAEPHLVYNLSTCTAVASTEEEVRQEIRVHLSCPDLLGVTMRDPLSSA